MERDEFKRTPDAILAEIKAEEASRSRGRLKVFFGMAPGVGKTYAMLQAAADEQKKGCGVLIGVVETHGRRETEALLGGLEVLPRRHMEYRGTECCEFDLEEALRRKPELILMDELAHTNVPSCTHEKRYQDVEELLANGIDVFTTVNVQHLESRADAVAAITGATVRETVPDSVVTNADLIQLVDLTPAQLRTRLEEGKVYLPDRAKMAVQHFFKDSNLAALREMALRLTAEWVGHELIDIRRDTGRKAIWHSGARLMVAVGPSPFSTRLVRWTRRMAYAMNAPWIALSIETGASLAAEDQARLDKNLELARLLGAEVMVVPGGDIAEALLRVARLHNVTQIVVGKPREAAVLGLFYKTTLIDRLIRDGGGIDIYIVPADEEAACTRRRPDRTPVWDGREFAWVLGGVATATALGLVCRPVLGYFTPSFFYLFVVMALGLFIRPWAVLSAAVLSAVLWNLLFIPPLLTLDIARAEDMFMCTFFLIVALTIGRLTARLKARERRESERTDRALSMYLFTRDVATARSASDMLARAQDRIYSLTRAPLAFFLPKDREKRLEIHTGTGSYDADDKEKSVADWCFRNRQCAGRTTQTLPGARGYYVPMMSGNRCMGVLGIWLSFPPTVADRTLLSNMAAQLAVSLESDELEALRSKALVTAASEKLNRTLLDSVSHEFKTPLAVIVGLSEQLSNNLGNQPGGNAQLCREIGEASRRLEHLVKNLLDMTRIESGKLNLHVDWCAWEDIVSCALESTRAARREHVVHIDLPEELPLFRADFSLMEQVLVNLVLNACVHTPAGTEITLRGSARGGGLPACLDVADNGPGIPGDMRECLFERFRGSGTGGFGLGLSIVKGFLDVLGGTIELVPSKFGAHFRISMPCADASDDHDES